MFRYFRIFAAALTAAALATPAAALESHHLHSSGDWKVYLEIYSDNSYACSAQTKNHEGDTFDLTYHDSGDLDLWMFFHSMGSSLPFRADIEIHVDYEVYTIDNVSFKDISGYARIGTGPAAINFVQDIMEGSAIALKRNDGRGNAATWSLWGSYAAMQAFAECMKRITPGINS